MNTHRNLLALYAGLAAGFVLGMLFALSLTISRADPDAWTRADTIRESAYYVFHFADWNQTRQIAANPDKYYELNPILGEHPSIADVDRYFFATAIIHTGIAYTLPADWRHAFQYFTIGAQAATVGWNYRAGLKVQF